MGRILIFYFLILTLSIAAPSASFFALAPESQSKQIFWNQALRLYDENNAPFIRFHAARVALLVKMLVEELRLEKEFAEEIYHGALIHDLGLNGYDRIFAQTMKAFFLRRGSTKSKGFPTFGDVVSEEERHKLFEDALRFIHEADFYGSPEWSLFLANRSPFPPQEAEIFVRKQMQILLFQEVRSVEIATQAGYVISPVQEAMIRFHTNPSLFTPDSLRKIFLETGKVSPEGWGDFQRQAGTALSILLLADRSEASNNRTRGREQYGRAKETMEIWMKHLQSLAHNGRVNAPELRLLLDWISQGYPPLVRWVQKSRRIRSGGGLVWPLEDQWFIREHLPEIRRNLLQAA